MILLEGVEVQERSRHPPPGAGKARSDLGMAADAVQRITAGAAPTAGTPTPSPARERA
jgi:hypothetical protein